MQKRIFTGLALGIHVVVLIGVLSVAVYPPLQARMSETAELEWLMAVIIGCLIGQFILPLKISGENYAGASFGSGFDADHRQ